ncbi:MAG: ABC transporter permease [Chitinispirillaceae bacterium]|nr:ABC transporter permease [Chitinispirillaceae bacterium]
MRTFLVRSITQTGRTTIESGANLVEIGSLFFTTLGILMRPTRASIVAVFSQFSRQMLYTGVEAFWLVSAIAFVAGSTIIMQAMTNMPKFGVSEYFGNILVIAVVRELGPFFTSIVVIGRSGAALASHIGTMRVNKEVAALEVMGIDPVYFLVMPALAGMVGAMICLNVYFDMVAIVGGLIVASFTVDVPFAIFLTKVLDAFTWVDILISTLKSTIFGVIIAIVSCHYGLKVATIRGVPQAAIKSVVGSMTGIIVVSVIVTVIMVMGGFYAR